MGELRRYSAEDFRRRALARFQTTPLPVGDHLLNPHLADFVQGAASRPAAVLVPVIHREPEATVLLTVRTAHLRAHAGQIAFPGGRIDPEDAGPVAAALREATEEIGLDAAYVETLTVGPEYLTGSGYRIFPVLAVVRPDFELTINADEVADTFEVPLSFLMDPANHRKSERFWQGAMRSFHEMPFGERQIWGATAGILRLVYEHLYDGEAEPAP